MVSKNKVTGKKRRRLKGSIRKLKHIQRLYGLNAYQQNKMNELIELLNKKQDERTKTKSNKIRN